VGYLGLNNLERIHGSVYMKIFDSCSITDDELEKFMEQITSSATNNIKVFRKSCEGSSTLSML